MVKNDSFKYSWIETLDTQRDNFGHNSSDLVAKLLFKVAIFQKNYNTKIKKNKNKKKTTQKKNQSQLFKVHIQFKLNHKPHIQTSIYIT